MDQSPDITNALASLPVAVKNFIYSAELTEKVIQLGKKYGLHLDVMGSMEREINLTLAGVMPLNTFSANIGSIVRDAEKTSKILADIEAQIFAPLKAKEKEQIKMNPVQQIQKPVAIPTPPPPPAPPASIVETKMATTVAPTPVHQDVPMILTPPPTPQATQDIKKPIDTTGIPKHKYPGSVDPYREPAE